MLCRAGSSAFVLFSLSLDVINGTGDSILPFSRNMSGLHRSTMLWCELPGYYPKNHLSRPAYCTRQAFQEQSTKKLNRFCAADGAAISLWSKVDRVEQWGKFFLGIFRSSARLMSWQPHMAAATWCDKQGSSAFRLFQVFVVKLQFLLVSGLYHGLELTELTFLSLQKGLLTYILSLPTSFFRNVSI